MQKNNLTNRVSNFKFNCRTKIFYEVELVTQNKSFHKNFEISNSKCDVISRDLIFLLDFVTQELSR